jgi:ferric-dicitrate binding protein FerR (iron transport regulator)
MSEDNRRIEEEAIDWFVRVETSNDNPEVRAGRDRWLAQDPRHQVNYLRACRIWRRVEEAGMAHGPPLH